MCIKKAGPFLALPSFYYRDFRVAENRHPSEHFPFQAIEGAPLPPPNRYIVALGLQNNQKLSLLP
jgi:hypothetical protein